MQQAVGAVVAYFTAVGTSAGYLRGSRSVSYVQQKSQQQMQKAFTYISTS